MEDDRRRRVPEIDPATDEASGDSAYSRAMARAGRLLAVRARTEHELRSRLSGAGAAPEDVDRVLARLAELGLVDDRDFAARWVEERSRRKGLGPTALVAELESKGVEREVAEQAVAEAGLDEERQARTLATRFVARVAHRPLREQRVRLEAMLLRRGISHDAAAAGVRAVLPPEGWD